MNQIASYLNTQSPDFLSNPNYHDALAILKGIRSGLVYGAKIRFPHALVMTLLFRSQLPLGAKVSVVMDATKQHSRNLGMFVGIYKGLLVLMRRMRVSGKEESGDAFLAGLVGGYIVFGKDNNINQQIVLYLFSRIMVGVAKLLTQRGLFSSIGLPPSIVMSDGKTRMPEEGAMMSQRGEWLFPVFASMVWATVMWLFRHERQTLQPSLQASMQYLYNDSEHWSNLRNWIWHSK